LGCGTGIDSRYLTTNGFQVIAVDHSGEALKITGATAPLAHLGQVDIIGGLPFSRESFQVIIANLSLHYFQWSQTQNIVKDVFRCLRPGGVLLARFNSKKDVNYGATGGEEIEPGYFFVNGILKRFFDQESLMQLFQTGWKIHRLEEMEVNRYRSLKVAWEVIVEKTG
jgi:SAM-dependent methyltransferase